MAYVTRWPLAALFIAVLILPALGCGDGDGGEGQDAGSDADMTQALLRREVLRNLGEGVSLGAYTDFAQEAGELEAALNSYAGAPTPTNLSAAQSAWRDAVLAWQRAEMMQFGPLAARGLSSGGEDIRDEIYAWPLENRCAADQATVSDDVVDPAALATRPVSSRGLGMLEYLLFVDTTDNSCSPLANINQDGIWSSRTPTEIVALRATHAASLGEIVRDQADRLVSRWAVDGFRLEVTDPTRGGALYGTAQEGLNAISDALFYLDKETKDMKLGEPIGITCESAPVCPETRESKLANLSKEMLLENLRGFQALYHGGPVDGPEAGFKELLESMGAQTFADQMASNIDAAIAAVEAIPGTLRDSAGTPEAAAAHAAIQTVTNDLKGMFVGVLDFETPNRAAGDND